MTPSRRSGSADNTLRIRTPGSDRGHDHGQRQDGMEAEAPSIEKVVVGMGRGPHPPEHDDRDQPDRGLAARRVRYLLTPSNPPQGEQGSNDQLSEAGVGAEIESIRRRAAREQKGRPHHRDQTDEATRPRRTSGWGLRRPGARRRSQAGRRGSTAPPLQATRNAGRPTGSRRGRRSYRSPR